MENRPGRSRKSRLHPGQTIITPGSAEVSDRFASCIFVGRDLISKFKSFWTAEEVPRWFGLSVVLVYLVGVGFVGHFSVISVREQAVDQYRSGSGYAVQNLTRRLSSIARDHVDNPTGRAGMSAYQRALRDFSTHVDVNRLRIVDSRGLVIASTAADEIGSIRGQTPVHTRTVDGMQIGEVPADDGGEPDRLFRTVVAEGNAMVVQPPTATADTVSEDKGHAPKPAAERPAILYLEVTLPGKPVGITSFADHSGALFAILVVCGVLFALFRCLRTQLRGVSLIANRLQSPLDSVKQDLVSLRVADMDDAVTSAWNQLVELAAELQEEVVRSQANKELSVAFAGSSGGALALALNAVPDAIMYIAQDGRFEYVNATACRLLKWGEDEVKDATLATAKSVGVGEQILGVLRTAHQQSGGFDSLTQVIEPDSGETSHRVWVIPLQEAKHQGECVAIVRDVSQQIRSEKAREEFVTQITHELRTPLTNIRAYAETLSSGMFDDPKMITDCYNVITKETRRLSRLIEDILSVSQMEVGSIELTLDSVDLKALLSDGIGDVRGLADEKDVDLQLVLPAKLEPIRADRDKLAVVIINLLGNAIKYTSSNGSIIVGCQSSQDEVSITFKDNGIGIEPADHARVFEKFQRADDPDVQSETGTGIGLYTAREIVRRHGGEIDLMSEKGQGSTFIVRLPSSESRASSLNASQEA